jgi:glycosyltransferase involved in cell wall biosynthesis
LSVPPTLVARLASSLPALEPGPPPLAEPYFLMLGTIEPRKNHRLLLEAWQRMGAAAPKLVVVGQRGWECEDIFAALQRSSHVVYKAGCSDAELVTLLAHARALVLPSFAEGFGIPVVEALTLGVPVIASDLPVFREFALDVPAYLDPHDADAWTRAIVGFDRGAHLARLARYHAPTWAEHLAAVERFLGELR